MSHHHKENGNLGLTRFEEAVFVRLVGEGRSNLPPTFSNSDIRTLLNMGNAEPGDFTDVFEYSMLTLVEDGDQQIPVTIFHPRRSLIELRSVKKCPHLKELYYAA